MLPARRREACKLLFGAVSRSCGLERIRRGLGSGIYGLSSRISGLGRGCGGFNATVVARSGHSSGYDENGQQMLHGKSFKFLMMAKLQFLSISF
jgi:hypothetical protein